MLKQILMLGDRVGIETVSKNKKKPESGFDDVNISGEVEFSLPEPTDNLGIVKFIGEDVKDPKYKVGDKVYYGSDRERVRMEGGDIVVMPSTNVLAVIKEEGNAEKKED